MDRIESFGDHPARVNLDNDVSDAAVVILDSKPKKVVQRRKSIPKKANTQQKPLVAVPSSILCSQAKAVTQNECAAEELISESQRTGVRQDETALAKPRRRQCASDNQSVVATAAPLSDGQFRGETHCILAIDSDDGAQSQSDAQSVCSPVIAEIIQLWRMRQRWHRAEKSLVLQGKAFCRAWTRGDKDAANKLFADAQSDADVDISVSMALMPFLSSIENFEKERKSIEKQLRKLSRSLPVWSWVESIRGFGDLNLAAIVGEAGDIGNYRNPSCLWKRMGLAVINGERQRKKSDPDEALLHGYNPSRRCVAYLLGETLVKAGEGCPYRPLYTERKARKFADFEKQAVENPKKNTAPKAHSHNDAMRYITKRALRDLWCAWRRALGRVEPSRTMPVVSISAKADPPAFDETKPQKMLPGEPNSLDAIFWSNSISGTHSATVSASKPRRTKSKV